MQTHTAAHGQANMLACLAGPPPCSWLWPRLAGVEELRLALDATRLPRMARPPRLPADLLLSEAAAAAAAAGPLPLAKLSIQWHGSAALAWHVGSRLPLRNLRKLSFPGGTRLWVDGSPFITEGARRAGCRTMRGVLLPRCLLHMSLRINEGSGTLLWKPMLPLPSQGVRLPPWPPQPPPPPHPTHSNHPKHLPLAELPCLTDFGLIDGLLVGELDLPWLPPSVTMLALAAVGLTRLPGVLAYLPRLQR